MPLGILVAPDGTRAWVATAGANEIVELDLTTFRATRAIRTGATPDGMALVK
jgi:DNA-binding beta-propeller fold protein YncE